MTFLLLCFVKSDKDILDKSYFDLGLIFFIYFFASHICNDAQLFRDICSAVFLTCHDIVELHGITHNLITFRVQQKCVWVCAQGTRVVK